MKYEEFCKFCLCHAGKLKTKIDLNVLCILSYVTFWYLFQFVLSNYLAFRFVPGAVWQCPNAPHETTKATKKKYTGNPPILVTLFTLQSAQNIWKYIIFNFFYLDNVVSCVYYVVRVKIFENNPLLNVLCVL